MIERHVTFVVLPGKEVEFVDLVRADYAPAMRTMPGFVKLDLLRDTENPANCQMVIRFESAAAAQAWRDSPLHQALKPRLKALCSESSLQVYDVVLNS